MLDATSMYIGNMGGNRYAVHKNTQVIFQGTYPQCLIVYGALLRGHSFREAVDFAKGVKAVNFEEIIENINERNEAVMCPHCETFTVGPNFCTNCGCPLAEVK